MDGIVAIGRPGRWFALTTSMLAMALAALGCGSSAGGADSGATGGGNPGGVFSCTVSQSDGTHTVTALCIEGTVRLTIQAACTGPDAGPSGNGAQNTDNFAQAPCTHDGAVGGCTTTFGGNSQTNWYYGAFGFTTAQVQQLCPMTGATYVAP